MRTIVHKIGDIEIRLSKGKRRVDLNSYEDALKIEVCDDGVIPIVLNKEEVEALISDLQAFISDK